MISRTMNSDSSKQVSCVYAENDLYDYLDTLLDEVKTTKDTNYNSDTISTEDNQLHESQTIHHSIDLIKERCPVTKRENKPLKIIPPWAKFPIQVLMFDISGIKFCIPLLSLLGIVKIDNSISKIPGQPIWHLGVIYKQTKKIVVVDISRMIMPERVDISHNNNNKQLGFLLLIGNGEFGFLIDKLRDTVKIEELDIRWKKNSENQTWMAGILVDQLSVMLNVDVILEMIKK